MAYKLNLSRPYHGMSHIWNVSDQVGDPTKCRNNPTDVDLVSLLIGAYIRFGGGDPPKMHSACKQPFLVNGQMDVNVAFWIRLLNYSSHGRGMSWTDGGIISRARKANYSNGIWSIVRLNYVLSSKNRPLWEDFPNHAQCPPLLKRELLSKTSP